MPYSILFVDETHAALKDFSCDCEDKLKLLFASSYEDALGKLGNTRDCRVLIAELNLNGEDGMAFLEQVQKRFPRTVRLILTESKKFEDVRDALNSGVLQYLEKPCAADVLKGAVCKALQKSKEDRERRNSLLGSVKALIDILDMVNPAAMGFAKRIRDLVVETGKDLGFRPIWQLELAVMLSHIGCVALPSAILKKVDQGKMLTPEEKQIFGMHPDIAANLLANIPEMAPIAGIISRQHETLSSNQPLGSRIIKVALDLDRFGRAGRDPLTILDKMSAKTKLYDHAVVKSMLKFYCDSGMCAMSRQINVEQLEEGMIMARDLVNKDGTTLLLRGQSVSRASLIRLKAFHVSLGVLDQVHVVDTDRATG